MKAECACGIRLHQLYWSKHLEPENHSRIIDLEDYYYCHKCNLVYQREIQTEVIWTKLQTLATTARDESA